VRRSDAVAENSYIVNKPRGTSAINDAGTRDYKIVAGLLRAYRHAEYCLAKGRPGRVNECNDDFTTVGGRVINRQTLPGSCKLLLGISRETPDVFCPFRFAPQDGKNQSCLPL
jgi:hypothetical protein